MATNAENSAGDTEMAECDGEEIVTMMDVLKEQQDFEDDANAVLGGSDEKECTYSQGYIKRQAIYACMTCCPDSRDDPAKRAGFCLACSLSCHENHDLVELYTKRNFRCDCGNPKFKSPCQFTPNKPELNNENVYNQNFIGLYCSCNKPYGDQESTLDDEMIQCIICEDWWHATHLDAVVPANEQYSEMVCKLCMAKNEFLHDYSDLTVNVETGDVDVVKVNGVDSNIEVDKLTIKSLTDEKLINGSATDEKQTNDVNEGSTINDMKTSTTEAMPKSSQSDVSSTAKESIEIEKSDDTIEAEISVEIKENKSNMPMDADVIDKSAEVLLEMSSEEKLETTPSCESSNDKEEESATKNKAGEACETTEDNTEGSDGPSTEKQEEGTSSTINKEENSESAGKSNNCTETADESEPHKDSDVSSAPNDSEVIEKPSEHIHTNESKIAKYQDIDTDAEKEKEDKGNVETDMPGGEDIENTSGNAKIAEAVQDEDMNDIEKSKEEELSEGNPQDINADKPANGELKKIDSTNNIESESNDNKALELTSTENKRKMDDVTDDTSIKKSKLNESNCLRPKGNKIVHKGATFWPATFRQKLCTCNECISMYRDLSVLFLTDLEDTVYAYETLGKERTAGKPNQYEKGMEALCSLGRIQQIDALTEYNKMRDKLLTFLKSFKDKKEIVTENDIKTFFAGMKPEKRTDGVYFCR